jgi:predicted esterase
LERPFYLLLVMQELQVTFNFKARYFKLGEINQHTKSVWFVLHGYGQLAQYFLKKFKSLSDHGVCVIAPEGLSRFYLEDAATRNQTGNTRVGATWMTRENRLMEIDNYLVFLNTVYKTELQHYPGLPVTLLGFSQGSATASRWILNKGESFQRLILWAGIFPDDMDFEKGKALLKTKEVYQVYGSQDPFLTPDRLLEMKTLAEKIGVTSNPIVFEGGHELHEPTLLKLL